MDYVDFKGKYSGRAFVIGNGTSLTPELLDKIIGEYSFGCARINRMYPLTEWRPSFYGYFDGNMRYKDVLEDVKETVELGIPCFIKSGHDGLLSDYDNVCYMATYKEGSNKLDRQSIVEDVVSKMIENEIPTRIHGKNTVLHPLMLVAFHLGFEELYLLGCDLDYTKPHFYPETFPEDSHRKPPDKMECLIYAHQLINEYANRKGFKVYNATEGGLLDVYERVALDEVLA